jgi:hypothetical protein
MFVDRKGAIHYQHEYPSPKNSFGESLKESAFSETRRPTTRWAGSRIFFFTGDEDAFGHEGFSLVDVDPVSGNEAARIWFKGRDPDYTLDETISAAYYRRDDTTLDAVPFLDGQDLDFAVRNGYRPMAERLLAMGVSPTATDSLGWAPIHYAALGGHADVARLLLDRGAKRDDKTSDGWTPWMLALREQHDSLATALRGNDTTSFGVHMANTWRLVRLGKIPEGLAELKQAAAQDSTLGLWSATFYMACWRGALADQATAVLSACDRAVVTSASDAYLGIQTLRARAVARALTGNLEGAARDLEAAGAWPNDGTTDGRWVLELRAGRNPFTPELLETWSR